MSSFINEESTVDTVRKIFLIIAGCVLILVYLISLVKLWKVNDKRFLHIETIAVFSCAVKVFLILIEEFLVNDEIFEFVTITLQTTLLGFILYKLVKTAVEHTPMLLKNITAEVWILRGFYLVILAALIVNMILGITNSNYFSCESRSYSYNWYILMSINTLLCYLNLIFGCILFYKRNHKTGGEEDFNVSNRDYSRVKLQMSVLTYGYALVSTLSLLWFILFPVVFTADDITCKEHPSYWRPHDEVAGTLAFIKTILLLAPTIVIWLAFFYFRLPRALNNETIRLNGYQSEQLSSSMMVTKEYDPVHMENSYLTNNVGDTSQLTVNCRKSAFTSNLGVTQSFAREKEKL